MRPERVLFVRELDPARIADYRRDHDNVWPELVALYKRCGITEVSCFIGGSRLAVLFETDPAIFSKMRETLASDPIELNWQAAMAKYDVPGTKALTFDEVYRQSDHG